MTTAREGVDFSVARLIWILSTFFDLPSDGSSGGLPVGRHPWHWLGESAFYPASRLGASLADQPCGRGADIPKALVRVAVTEPLERTGVKQMKYCVQVALGVLLLSQALGAAAAADNGAETTTIAYGELDLSTTDGAQALYQRIKRAARKVCQTNGLMSVERHRRARECYDRVVADAVSQVNRPLVASVHDKTQIKNARRRS